MASCLSFSFLHFEMLDSLNEKRSSQKGHKNPMSK